MLPIDLVLVRHGESEGNVAVRKAKKGDEVAYTDAFKARHSSNYRLSDRGKTQAIDIGALIGREFINHGVPFDRYYVSEFIRAIETAAYLNIPEAKWYRSPFLTERQWGDLDALSPKDQVVRFPEAIRMRETEPFFSRPPNGESYNDLCLRLSKVLETLHRECSDQRVVIVCHGEVMWGFRFLLERMSLEQFRVLHDSKHDQDKIRNCQIVHYTRRDPVTQRLAKNANWMRMLRAGQPDFSKSTWQQIERKTYSSEQLLDLANSVERMIA